MPASPTSPSMPTPTATLCTSRPPTRPTPGQGDRRRTYLVVDKLLDVAKRSGADAVHPGYGFPVRERRLRPGGDRRRADLDRTAPGGHPLAGRQGLRPAHRTARRCPAGGGHLRPVSGRRRGRGVRQGERAADRDQGRVRWRRPRPEGRPHPRRDPGTVRLGGAARRWPRSVAAECFVERYLDNPRTWRPRCSRTRRATLVVVSTRDCSLQRRHQKLVEEAPRRSCPRHRSRELYRASKAIVKGGRLRRGRYL